MGRRKGEKIMKIPAEFEDILRGVELTEREALFLSWITSWDDYTVQNMRTVVEKVRSALSTLQAENEKLRAELEQARESLDFARTKDAEIVRLGRKLEQVKRELQAYKDTGLEPEDFKRAFSEDTILKLAGQALGITPDRLRELAQTDKDGKIKAYIVDGFYCDICQKRHDRIKEIKVYLTRDAAEAALSERR